MPLHSILPSGVCYFNLLSSASTLTCTFLITVFSLTTCTSILTAFSKFPMPLSLLGLLFFFFFFGSEMQKQWLPFFIIADQQNVQIIQNPFLFHPLHVQFFLFMFFVFSSFPIQTTIMGNVLYGALKLLALTFSFCFSQQNQIFRCHHKPMGVHETNSGSGYDKPPWIFKGSALYQLHLVKAETARAFIPKEFRLVEAFGYTLGGFFLASYDDSPAGIFDELVVIAGTVWNPPTSCAWAARVLVNSDEACTHGRRDVGLPSQVARFSKNITATTRRTNSKINDLLSSLGIGNASCSPNNVMDIRVSEIDSPATGICNIARSSTAPKLNTDKWMGPLIKMSLPSFSGRTEYNPQLLKYSCQIQCRVRPISPAKVSGPLTLGSDGEHSSDSKNLKISYSAGEDRECKRDLSVSIMLSKPILALEFSCLKMVVEPPVIVSKDSRNSTENSP